MVEGLVLININPCAEGWMDWAAHKVSANHFVVVTYIAFIMYRELEAFVCHGLIFLELQISGWTHAMPDMIISHLFGKVSQCLT